VVGVQASSASARCAPNTRAQRLRAVVETITATTAMKLYPPCRGEETVLFGLGRSLDMTRKASSIKAEKEVKEPQNPVVNPMYSGILFLIALSSMIFLSLSSFSLF
jgi:hypothetical protein